MLGANPRTSYSNTVSRILVLGGYGGFGGRISRRLAAAGHEVLVAGRSEAKARRFCAAVAGAVPLALDRGDIERALSEQQPAIVVDASGPFQAMDYRVPRACINARVHYCDIADGREFVCGIESLTAAARAAGVAVIAGASSVPALSGAVVRALIQEVDRVHGIEMAISASNRANAGPAVAAAILGQVGQKLRLRRAGRWIDRFGWQEVRRQDFSVPQTTPISGRLVALVDVPDLELLPKSLPGEPACSFRAGTELDFQNLALWLASWPVRWGWISDLSGLAKWLGPFHRLTECWGSDRSAMIVRLFGERDGERVERRWTLIADQGDGPEIPTLSVPPLVERILAGEEPAGARDAGRSLSLGDYAPAFAALSISSAIEELSPPPPLYRRLMGPEFEGLPAAVRAMHQPWREAWAEGEAEVTGAASPLGRVGAWIMGFPSPGRHKLRVDFIECDGVERWTRNFGGQFFASELSAEDGCLVERFGPLRFRFDLPADGAGLTMMMRSWSAFRLPLPLLLAPRSLAREWEEDGRFQFDVSIALPLVGPIIRYRGWLSSHVE